MLLLLKKHSATLISPIAHLVNLSIKTGEFPQNFKTAVVTPFLSLGRLMRCGNYRPISIVPVISKVLEKLVVEQLMNYLEKNNLLNPKQFGFRPKHSTEMAICNFIDNIKSSLDQGKVVEQYF